MTEQGCTHNGTVGFYCDECSRKQPQTYIDDDGGKYRKVGFPINQPDQPRSEWMWVRVIDWDNRAGVLANVPQFVTEVQPLQIIRFTEGPDGRMVYVP